METKIGQNSPNIKVLFYSLGGAGATSLFKKLNPPESNKSNQYLPEVKRGNQPLVVEIEQPKLPYYKAQIHDFYQAERFPLDWRRPYFCNAKVIIPVINSTLPFDENQTSIKEHIERYAEPDAIILGLANKQDLRDTLSKSELERKFGFEITEISAKWSHSKDILLEIIWKGVNMYYEKQSESI